MNNRILAALFALTLALFIGVAPVKAEAKVKPHEHVDTSNDYICDVLGCDEHVHHLTHFAEKDATCTENGNIEYWQCLGGTNACGKCYADEAATKEIAGTETVVKATGHVDDDGDCICDDCKQQLAHKLTKVPGTAPTCETPGEWGHYECEVCHRLFSESDPTREVTAEDVIRPKLEHVPSTSFEGDLTTHWHTCANDSTEKLDVTAHTFEMKFDGTNHWLECTVCNYQKDVTPHDWEWESKGDYSGKHVATCKDCGKVYNADGDSCVDEDGDCYCNYCEAPMPHEVSDLTTVKKKNATCTEPGMEKHYLCETCSQIFKLEEGKYVPTTQDELRIEPLDHLVSEGAEWKRDATGHWHVCERPGCEEKVDYAAHTIGEWLNSADGTKHWHQCSVCRTGLDIADHEYVPVSNGDGTHTLTCKVCGVTSGDPIKCMDSLKDEDCACDDCKALVTHSIKMLSKIDGVPATCTKDGTIEHYQCKTCKKLFVKKDGAYVEVNDVTEKALGHDWVFVENISVDVDNPEKTVHLFECSRCPAHKTGGHVDSDNDCYCDLEACGALVHSHKIIEVPGQKANCLQEGFDTYYKYEGCDTFFEDAEGTKPLKVLVKTAKTDHTWGAWTSEGDNHVRICTVCGTKESGEHVDETGRDNRCDICGVELELTYVGQVDPTCLTAGIREHWVSSTGRTYADANGNDWVQNLDDLIIPALGHDWSEWESNGLSGHTHHCTRDGCTASETEKHTNVISGCVCDVCFGAIEGHTATYHGEVPATCTTSGTKAYVSCTCGKMYDVETHEQIEAPIVIPATGHKLSSTLVQDTRLGNHYQVCENEGCYFRAYSDHDYKVEDPLKGNYHQFVCECGYVKTEVHYDKDGDKKCDECGHDMSNTTITVEQHDSVKVTTGEKDKVDNTKTWWQNWWSNITSSNAGSEASGNTTTTTSGSGSTTAGSSSGTSTGTPAASDDSTTTSSGSTGSGSSVEDSGSASVESSSAIDRLILFLTELLNKLIKTR